MIDILNSEFVECLLNKIKIIPEKMYDGNMTIVKEIIEREFGEFFVNGC